jgi:hypothetical protein
MYTVHIFLTVSNRGGGQKGCLLVVTQMREGVSTLPKSHYVIYARPLSPPVVHALVMSFCNVLLTEGAIKLGLKAKWVASEELAKGEYTLHFLAVV